MMKRAALFFVAAAVALGLTSALNAQARSYALESAQGLTLHNVSAVPVVLQDKKGVKVTLSDEAAQRLRAMAADQQAPMEQLALIDGVDFDNGTIEAEIAGAPAPGAPAGARGFVGIAFRVQKDLRTYDAFYLRPTNGRADDQERRNHAVQYIAHPDWPWFRLRKETPSKYRGLRRPRPRRVDEGQNRGARRPRTPLRQRFGTADAPRQRPQVGRDGQGRRRAVARSGNRRALSQPQRATMTDQR